MSFKILLKQSFRSLSKKFRLYLSLIIFLIVAFSMIAGIGTYFTTWRSDMQDILNTGKDQNFEIPKFKFTSKDDSTNENVLFRFSESGQNEFVKFIDGWDPKLSLEPNSDEAKTFIKNLGDVSGNVSLISNSNVNIDKLNSVSRYYGHNLIFMFLDQKLKEKNNGILLGNYDYVSGVDSKDRSITFNIRPLAENKNGFISPFDENQLNEIHKYKSKKISDAKLNQYKKDGANIPFYVNPKYLRDTKHKVGDEISVVVNNNEVKGYIAGLRSDKYHIFFSNNNEALYMNLDDFDKVTNGNFIDAEALMGYYPINNSDGAFNNEKEYRIAYKNIHEILLSDGNDPNKTDKLFVKNNPQNATTILRKLDDTNAKVSFYHEPMNLYMGFMAVMIVVVCILVIIVSYFIIDESIRSEKKTLWFLKAMGETTFKISLLNSMSVIVPLFLALAISIPGTMLVMEFLTIAVTTDYAFTIPWFQLNWIFALMIVCFFIGILLIFLVINSALISGKALSIQSGDKLSRFQMFLAKTTNPMVKNANGKFRVGFAFIKQNLIKNLVSFVIFAILFTVTLFGVQFNRSIHNQENAYQKWMNPYHSISTLSPKKMVTDNSGTTNDKKHTTYQTLTSDNLKQLQDTDKTNSDVPFDNKGIIKNESSLNDNSSETYKNIVDTYNYDLFKYIAINWFDAIDQATTDNAKQYEDKTIIFDSSAHKIISMPKETNNDYYSYLSARLALIFSKLPSLTSSNNIAYPNYDEAKTVWNLVLNGGVVPDVDNPNAKINIRPSYNSKIMKQLMNSGNLNITTKDSESINSVSVAQWLLRQFKDISLWNIDYGYLESAMEVESSLPDDTKDKISKYIHDDEDKLPQAVKPAFQSIVSVLTAQKEIFGVANPSFSINFGNVISPTGNYKESTALVGSFKGTKLLGYGLDIDHQPFNNPIDKAMMDDSLHEDKSDEDGLNYTTIDAVFSEESKDQKRWKIGDVVPIDLAQTNIKPNDKQKPLALKIVGFKQNDSVLTEGFFNKDALKKYIKEVIPDLVYSSLVNTFYTETEVPYFLQHITVPHMMNDGKSIDDYIYKLDTFTSDHKTTDQISKVFADTVDSYASLMTKVIILLIILCFALSSIIITLIMFENKKTILLFKAMGYRKRDVIWYIISGYLIAALLALVFGFGISAAATFGLSSMFAAKIFLQLIFTPYWLWFVIGIFETACFMALVVVSIITYTRLLKPRDAFATL